ncbi:MAG: N(2)-acetyl-L-2,4-diaminobutanoate deacetylase DoeB [SAR324 cluster bacterium]|nr:N(2)-acetyl-L-2,4-diaminobutanoate deacetylase DoeB [SAR324 cluster bacterium]
MKPSPVKSTIDFEQDGLQHGFLKLPHSHDESAYGSVMIPISMAKNGEGPTALLTGGNHGDEYEGPIALFDLAQTIDPQQIRGRVILVPAMNYPAFQAGKRTSPIDSGNMNRSFPGNPEGSITEKITDYFQRTLLPLAEWVLDLHSGGKTLDFLPFCAAHRLEDKQQEQRCAEAMRAFNAPYSMMLLEIDSVGMYDTAAEAMGKVFITTELGGKGTATAETVRIAKRGIRNFLIHAGILEGSPQLSPSIHLDMPDQRCYIGSESNGLLEMKVDLGEKVQEGQLLAVVHDHQRTGTEPVPYHSQLDGILTARHVPGLIGMGDTLAVVATVTASP